MWVIVIDARSVCFMGILGLMGLAAARNIGVIGLTRFLDPYPRQKFQAMNALNPRSQKLATKEHKDLKEKSCVLCDPSRPKIRSDYFSYGRVPKNCLIPRCALHVLCVRPP